MDADDKSAQGALGVGTPDGASGAPDETPQNGASGPDPMDNQGNGFLNLVGIDVVVEELLQYLSVEDLLNLNSISKDALVAVRKSMEFSKRVQFRLSNELICSRVLDNCFHPWKTVVFYSDELDEKLVDYIPSSSTISQTLGFVQSFKVDLEYPKGEKVSVRSKIIDFVQNIVESSKETLKDLSLCLPCGGFIESIKCPKLQKLTLYISESTDDQLAEAFLKNQPTLEELTTDGICFSHLITGLQGRMFKLRKLDLGIGDVSHDGSTPLATDWSVVEGMTKLQDIHIELSSDYSKRSPQDIEEILSRIPEETVTKIYIYDFTQLDGCFSQKLGEHISRFNNLTELVLCCDLTNFDDDSLQSVIKGCPKLIKLTLMGLEKVTDFGFFGVKKIQTGDGFHFASNERGVALTDLKGLTELYIVDFRIISFATILKVIRFEVLTSLNFSGIVPSWQTMTRRQFVLQILQQNPSLIKIDLEIRSRIGDETFQRDNTLEDEVKTRYPRIQELKFEYASDYSDDDASDSDDDDDNVSDNDDVDIFSD